MTWQGDFSGFGGDPHNPHNKQDWASMIKKIRQSLLQDLEKEVEGMSRTQHPDREHTPDNIRIRGYNSALKDVIKLIRRFDN